MAEAELTYWWRGTSVYQIYPRSFQDSNNDGIGDLCGIITRLDYIKAAGFETIWLSPFFASPQGDFGYDVSDYYSTAPEFGTNEQLDNLISEVHSRGMHIVFDMVLNHTSDQHPWFVESRSSTDNPKRDWYVWKDGKKGRGNSKKPPNNWKSQVGGSGWQYDEQTGQWYWAAFLPFQPDLNYRNPEVKKAVFEMLEYWLRKGVDGFRLDIIGSVFEDKDFRSNPFIWKLLPDENNDGMLFQSTKMTQNLPESIEFCRELRELSDRFNDPPRFMVGETFGRPKEISRFCSGGRDGAYEGLHAAFAFKCTDAPFTATAFRELLEEYESCFAEPLLPAWAFSNHDRTRRISALGRSSAKAKLNAAFQITARGIPFFYYGEEIGMLDARLDHRQSLDPVSFPFKKLPAPLFNFINRKIHGAVNRDLVRTPMQWSSESNGGFCSENCSPWLPVNEDTGITNVTEAESNEDSILACFRRFLKLRSSSQTLRFGALKLIDRGLLPPDVLGYIRLSYAQRDENTEKIIVLLNFGDSNAKIDNILLGNSETKRMKLLASTRKNSSAAGIGKISLSAFEGVVLG